MKKVPFQKILAVSDDGDGCRQSNQAGCRVGSAKKGSLSGRICINFACAGACSIPPCKLQKHYLLGQPFSDEAVHDSSERAIPLGSSTEKDRMSVLYHFRPNSQLDCTLLSKVGGSSIDIQRVDPDEFFAPSTILERNCAVE
uniref:Uncharacterized protein n=1 Tax=Rhodosorus marinus TaxID=101924 RepID=A0A7S3A9V0_9RHOD|mmetsp:Transcript_8469/g.37762  ORF Transcript_8469/g.37762 Transcript_8469/m.37762 type:complete len:142 (+) Transcript_8469:422-847(+)